MTSKTLARLFVMLGVGAIALAMLIGPLFSSNDFSWLRHTTSEQAAQGHDGAWIMRAGFVAYGFGVFAAALLDWRRRIFVRLALAAFGAGLVATAIWSNAPITAAVVADMNDDRLHSIASGVVGAAFALACAARLFGPGGSRSDLLAWAGLLIAILIPAAMMHFGDIRGALQRAMFAFSFVFVLREFLSRRE